MTGDWNILFTSVGRRVALLRLFREALTRLGLTGRMIAADASPTAPARFVADAYESVPRVGEAGYVDRLLEICRSQRIRLLVPLIDDELLRISERRDEFLDLGTLPLVCSPEVNRICADKRLTFEFFLEAGISAPKILDPDQVLADTNARYPFIIKPARGSASVGVTRVENAEQLAFFRDYVPDAILQELVAGHEHTLDILVDLEGRVRCVVPRLRLETRAGEVSKGLTVRNPEIIAAGRRVVEAMPDAIGCITVQCFLSPEGEIHFIEINPRFGGGFPLSARAGADFPRWLLEMMQGQDPRIDPEIWVDGLMMLRFDDAIFVP